MPLSVGTRLGPYEIVAPLGAGGMGEVYRARDTRLNRQVAIKTLPDAFALDPDRVARFQREAQILASLSHPNIAAIHGLEESSDSCGLVLELVEGETLAEHLQRAGSGLPLDEALNIGRQVCDALEAAHENGVIHRDLKPANIKVTPAGIVKVLDFGLAKLITPGARPGASTTPLDVTNSPTMVTAMSMPGMLLGTAAYMSPEQAKGKEADRRADVWAFGCVVYEMLTGRSPFAGDSVNEIVSEVIKSEPDWNRLPAGTPASVERLLRRCLTKDPRRRLQHIGDARLELDEAADAAGEPRSSAPREIRRWKAIAASLATIAAIASAAALAGFALRGAPAPNTTVKRLHIQAPDGVDDVFFLAASPTGRQLALVGSSGGSYAIFIRSLESLEARRVADVGDRHPVFWSPNGESLGFFDGGQLKVLNVATGESRIVSEAPSPFGGSWGADDTIIFTPRVTGGVHKVSAQGGPVTEITTPDQQREESHRWPQFLPDGRRFIFMGWSSRATSSNTRYSVQMASVDASAPAVVAASSSAAIYDPAGYLLFAINSPPGLVAQPFDEAAGRTTGNPVTIAEDLSYEWITGAIPVTSSADGTLFYLNNRRLRSRLTWMSRDGRELGTVGEPGIYYDPDVSADSASFVVEKSDPSIYAGDIWRVDIGLGTLSRLTHEPTFENAAVLSPDGTRVVFSSDRDGLSHLFLRSADGSDQPVKLFGEEGSLAYASDWSPDGEHLLFTAINQQRNRDLWVLPMAGGGKARPLLQSAFDEGWATFSPDGRWIAYTSTESGESQVYIRSWPAFTGLRRVSTRGGRQPLWRGDGQELFYGAPDGGIVAVPISYAANGVQTGAPVFLFNPDLEMMGLRNRFGVTSDGQRFMVLKPITNRRGSPVTAVINWPAVLRPGS